tara:strand:- start:445 stop:1521 length:1077 start_codon:yes stop_codon:yes gene_type:complete
MTSMIDKVRELSQGKTVPIALAGIILSAAVLWALFTVSYDECGDDDDCVRIAYEVKDTYLFWEANPQEMADKLSELTGMKVVVYPVSNEVAAIEAVANGNAEIAMVDGAAGWLGYQVYDLDVVAVEKKPDGRVFYNAAAWVKADSEIAAAHLDDDPDTDPFEIMRGKKSCHTGWLKSAGMLIPMGYLIGNGYAEVVGDPNEIESLRATVTNFFNEDSEIPEGGTQYSGYKGAMKCMMTGHGDIALVKDTAYRLYCDENDDGVADGPDWCLELDELVMLPSFGQAPSHPVMYDPARMDQETMLVIQEALLALDDDAEGREILNDVLNTAGMVASTGDEHLGTYSDAVSNVPGIQAYIEK